MSDLYMVYLTNKHRFRNKIEKSYAIEGQFADGETVKASFIVNEYEDDWEIERIDVRIGERDRVDEVIDHYMMRDFRFECDSIALTA